ncbi:c-type cytochrome [Rhizobium leguminosarum]|uniref:c-type cytochrome n=1 Tax=Rhizobium leguminosarum TaxID=384 RepID=UPI0015F8EB31|nr:c-type cytochrome [Rhizobium leguminosarum]MBA9032904.1 cytochrome c1 [Rhizobium leguminosarum]MDI5928471.1 c-type cytochrome [Rhizobium leguminosarum]
MPDLVVSTFYRATWATAAVVAGLGALILGNVVRESETKTAAAVALTGGDPARAPALFRRYGCSGCHTIPGIPGADGQTGAPLTGLSKHVFIAGILENRSDNLVAWIVSPQSFSPQTAMPKTGISEQEAKDLAAYLYSH